MHAVLMIVSMTLLIGLGSVRLAARLRIPHSALLVLIGMFIGGFLHNQVADLMTWFRPHFSEIVVDLLLPILVFEASIQMDFRQLRKDLVPLVTLSVIGLLISTWVIGACLTWMMGLPELPALLFGALISATDPIAVIALFKNIRAPTRLTHLVEGESLINDGTAIVLFRVLLAMTLSQVGQGGWVSVDVPTGMMQFCLISMGGVVSGLVMGHILVRLLAWNRDSAPAQLGSTIVWTYLTYLLAEQLLGVSGVLATMALGWSVAQKKERVLSPFALEGLLPLWELLALAANSIVFLAVGFVADFSLFAENWQSAILVINVVFFARAVSVFGTLPVLNRLAQRLWRPLRFERIRKAYQIVLIWSGIRGGLALALVLSLPDGFRWKDVFLVLALAVVVSSNLVNAVATPWVLKFLRIRSQT